MNESAANKTHFIPNMSEFLPAGGAESKDRLENSAAIDYYCRIYDRY
jgi:hypothetical protein